MRTLFSAAHDDTVYCLSIHSVADLYMAKVSSLRAGTTGSGQEVGHGNIPLLLSPDLILLFAGTGSNRNLKF